ncbi:hypothetical protein FGU71_02090 [Erythrobacter insulae]|uniref:DUF4893 domain-containing protein n=1 Tax=Erythrobacter insulae TaxID=2584124 RepID=A0A547P9E8_9SPHN|nr:hypothetical protein [Erythrobacter insulae]TRD10775.1 hypothetical protein FGU71_02090 [Erythrobacter insulae]
MIARMIFAAMLAAVLPFASPSAVLAKDESGFVQLRKEEPVEIAADRAYFLMRVPEAANSIFFLRVPSDEELQSYEAAKRAEYDRKSRKMPYEEFVFDWEDVTNLYEVRPKRQYVELQPEMRVQIVAAPPGDYVVYGLGYNGFLYQCNCMGSVGFSAKAGQVTDLGTFLISNAWDPSPFPELNAESDLGRVARMDFGMFAFGIKAAEPQDFIPPQLSGSSLTPAAYKAIGPWVDRRRVFANRLATMPGVLEYREGIPFDPVTAQELRLSLDD